MEEEEEEFLGFLETRLRFNQAAQKCMSCQTKIEGKYFGKANQRTSERARQLKLKSTVSLMGSFIRSVLIIT